MESRNSSQKNFTDFADELGTLYTAVGIIHIVFVILPTLVLGPLILYLMASKYKKSDRATSIVFITIVLVCTIAPLTYGLLMDLSLITDFPFLGGCRVPLMWVLYAFSHIMLTVVTALLSVVQYCVLRLGKKKKLTVVTKILVIMSASVAFLAALMAFFRSIDDNPTKVRGSYCVVQPGSLANVFNDFRQAFYVVALFIPTVVVVVIFSILSYRHVKRNIIDNAAVVKTVLRVMIIVTLSTILLRVLPSLTFALGFTDQAVVVASRFIASVSIELNYPLYLVLILLVHKSIRETFKEKAVGLLRRWNLLPKENKVAPMTSTLPSQTTEPGFRPTLPPQTTELTIMDSAFRPTLPSQASY